MTTFLIYYFRDSDERERNLIAVCKWLSPRRILIWCDSHAPEALSDIPGCTAIGSDIRVGGVTHRTRARNILAAVAKTQVICQMDGDVIIQHEFLDRAEKEIIDGAAEFTTPFNQFFRAGENGSAHFCVDPLNRSLLDCRLTDQLVGGCSFANREAYYRIGCENQNYIGWGWEDRDRMERMERLGDHKRLEAPAFHLWHPEIERKNHSNVAASRAEFVKVRAMTNEELSAYVKSGFGLTKKAERA